MQLSNPHSTFAFSIGDYLLCCPAAVNYMLHVLYPRFISGKPAGINVMNKRHLRICAETTPMLITVVLVDCCNCCFLLANCSTIFTGTIFVLTFFIFHSTKSFCRLQHTVFSFSLWSSANYFF